MTVTLTGLDAVTTELSTARLTGAIQAATFAVALEVQSRMAKYPPQRHMKQPFKSAKQRRYFFWALHEGKIEVPYRRGSSPGSETLGRRWHVEHVGAMDARAVNTASYAAYVHGEGTQSAYMRAEGFLTEEGIARKIEAEGVVTRIATQAINHVFGGS
jgi:hypothetical protein